MVSSQQDDLTPMANLLKVHQIMRVYVVSKDDDSKLVLSARSSLINRGVALKHLFVGQLISAAVVSIEDHG